MWWCTPIAWFCVGTLLPCNSMTVIDSLFIIQEFTWRSLVLFAADFVSLHCLLACSEARDARGKGWGWGHIISWAAYRYASISISVHKMRCWLKGDLFWHIAKNFQFMNKWWSLSCESPHVPTFDFRKVRENQFNKSTGIVEVFHWVQWLPGIVEMYKAEASQKNQRKGILSSIVIAFNKIQSLGAVRAWEVSSFECLLVGWSGWEPPCKYVEYTQVGYSHMSMHESSSV